MTLLSLDAVEVRFGGVHALRGATLRVDTGECVGLVGPNGAGKSTLMNAVSGLATVSAGRITFEGADISSRPAWSRQRLGLARTFQLAREVSDITVLDYVLSGALDFRVRSYVGGILCSRRYVLEERQRNRRAMELLEELGLAEQARLPQREISLGARRLVDLARALMPRPRLLMMDEVVAGLEVEAARRISSIVQRKRSEGMTILLIEHDIGFVQETVDRVIVLTDGAVLTSGAPGEVLSRTDVMESFIGPTVARVVGHG